MLVVSGTQCTGSSVVNPFKNISIHVFEYWFWQLPVHLLVEETVWIAILWDNARRCRSRLRFCLRSTVLSLERENEDVHFSRQGKHRDYQKCLKEVFTQRIYPNRSGKFKDLKIKGSNRMLLQSFIFVNPAVRGGTGATRFPCICNCSL